MKNSASDVVVSVITDPIPIGKEFFIKQIKKTYRYIKGIKKNQSSNFGGHPSVTRSLIKGLEENGVSYNYNPEIVSELSKNVIVLSGIRSLKQAIKFKRQGRIDRLFAGPNIVVRSTDFNSIITSDHIDKIITPSKWVTNAYCQEEPILDGRCIEWPAGVDINFWKPRDRIERNSIIFFNKPEVGPLPPICPYIEYLERCGYVVDTIEYGSFSQAEFRTKLESAWLLVGFVKSESQGIAWAEAWAMNVPTLIFNIGSNVISGKNFFTSSAPYLTNATGAFFSNIEQFIEIMNNVEMLKFKPREWVMRNMTDALCADKILQQLIQGEEK